MESKQANGTSGGGMAWAYCIQILIRTLLSRWLQRSKNSNDRSGPEPPGMDTVEAHVERLYRSHSRPFGGHLIF